MKRPQSAGGSDYATLPDQVPISEPTTLLTDYLLAAVAIGLGVRLAATATGSRARQLWSVAFVVGGCAALAGGTVHGLRAWLDPLLTAWLWQCALLGSALAGTLLLAGAVLHALRGGALRLALVAIAAKLAVELSLIAGSGLTRDAVWAGAVGVVLLLALTLARARTDPQSVGWLLLGLALAGAGLAFFKMAGQIVRTLNITQSAVGKPDRWTTVIALAVFIPEENIPKRSRR